MRQSAQPGSAHGEFGRGSGKLGCVALPLAARTSRVIRIFMKGHHGIAEIVRLLDPGLPIAVEDEPPNVAGTLGGDVEVAALVLTLP